MWPVLAANLNHRNRKIKMAENLGFSEPSSTSEDCLETHLSIGENVANQQLKLFAHFASLSGNGNIAYNTSEEAAVGKDEGGSSVESSLENNGVLVLKQEPIEAETSQCENDLPPEFFSNSIPAYINYNQSNDEVSSVESGASWAVANDDGIYDTEDQEWKVSDEQVDTEDEEFEMASDPDEDKGPDPDYDDSEDMESEDSDYKPTKANKRKSKTGASPAGKRKCNHQIKRESYQDKINKLKKSIVNMDYMKVVSTVSGEHNEKDVSCLQVLLAGGQNDLTKGLLAKKLQGSTKKIVTIQPDGQDMRGAVEDILKKRNLLPSSLGPEISLPYIASYANLLCGERTEDNLTQLRHQPQSATGQSASQLLQSLSQSIKCEEQTKPENISNLPSVSCNKEEKNLDGLSGRSCLLLQHLLLKNNHKNQAAGPEIPSSSSIMALSQEVQTVGDSVLKSILTAKTQIIQREPAQRNMPPVKATLLRNLLDAPPPPLIPQYRVVTRGTANVLDSEEDKSVELENEQAAPESIGGYMVYVDHAVNDDDSVDLSESEKQDSPMTCEFPDANPDRVTIKTEPLSDHEPSESSQEFMNMMNEVPLVHIKSEPLSPCSETKKKLTAESGEGSHSESAQSEAVTHQDTVVKIKLEPASPTSFTYKYGDDSEPKGHAESLHSTAVHESLDNQDNKGSPHETGGIHIKSEPLSPSAEEAGEETSQRDSPVDQPHIKTEKMTANTMPSLMLTDSNLRTLLVSKDSASLYRPLVSEQNEELLGSQPKLGRPWFRQTLSHKIYKLKSRMDSGSATSTGGHGDLIDNSASERLQSLSRSSSKETILRGLMDGSSTSVLGLDSPEQRHSYNTRQQKKQNDTSLLEKALKIFQPTLPVVKNKTTMSPFENESSPVRIVQSSQTELQTACKVESVSPDNWSTDNTDSNRGPLFTQNASCSQQLLNIIRNVGASKIPSDTKGTNVNILKSMLNNDSGGHTNTIDSTNIKPDPDEPKSKYPKLAQSLGTLSAGSNMARSSPPNVISRRSGSFLNENFVSVSSPGLLQMNKTDTFKSHTVITASEAGSFNPKTASVSRIAGLATMSPDCLSSPSSSVGNSRSLITECPYQCRLCGSTFRSTSLLEDHMQVHFGSMPFGCSLCPKSFMTAKELEEHMKVHMSNLSPALVYKCTVCGSVFDTQLEHDHHRISHGINSKIEYKCHECDKLYASEVLRDLHLRTHRFKAKKCEICGLQFTDESRYNLHKAMIHENLEHSILIPTKHRHRSPHTGPKEFKCEKCDKGFVSKNGMMGHIAKCQGRPYPCTGCEESFLRKMELISHILNIHGHPSVRCDYCHKVFCYRSQLEEHQKEHEKELMQNRQTGEMSPGYDSDSLGTQNGLSFSIHRSAGPASLSDFSVQCLSEKSGGAEVVTISDSE